MLARSLLTNTGRRLYQLKLIATMELLAIFVTIHYPKKEKKISQRWYLQSKKNHEGLSNSTNFWSAESTCYQSSLCGQRMLGNVGVEKLLQLCTILFKYIVKEGKDCTFDVAILEPVQWYGNDIHS